MDFSRSVYRFILLPSFVGLICSSCTPVPNPTSKQASTGSGSSDPELIDVPTTAVPTAAPDLNPDRSAVAYMQSINLASSAYLLSQSAFSPDDWGLVASRWRQAADQLKQVAAADERYESAQQKIAEYGRNAQYADGQIAALEQAVSVIQSPAAQPIQTTAAANISVETSPQKVSVPIIRRLHGTPVVQVTFNNAKSYEMILDTGASRTLITRQMANELGVVATEKIVVATASEAEVVFEIGRVRSMSIGEVALQDVKVGIGDSVSIGLLGNDFLYGYDIAIRSSENVVELTAAN